MKRSQGSNGQPDVTTDPRARPGQNVVAVDGPAGSGKTTVAVRLAELLGAVFLDTGSLYRAVTLMASRGGLTPADGELLAGRIAAGAIRIQPPTVDDGRYCDVILDGEDVTLLLRSPDIDREVSAISAVPTVRNALLPLQRAFALDQRTVMVGRDIASVIFPDAAVKIYLNASPGERARRRWLELAGTGSALSLDDVLVDLVQRDSIDSNRLFAPLRVDDGANVVETDNKSIDEVVNEVAGIARAALGVA